jgi:hypothetical protein
VRTCAFVTRACGPARQTETTIAGALTGSVPEIDNARRRVNALINTPTRREHPTPPGLARSKSPGARPVGRRERRLACQVVRARLRVLRFANSAALAKERNRVPVITTFARSSCAKKRVNHQRRAVSS